jgi:hypothetical protein
MKRRVLFLIAAVLGLVALAVGPSLAPARAAEPPSVTMQTSAHPLMCFGLFTRGGCLSLS